MKTQKFFGVNPELAKEISNNMQGNELSRAYFCMKEEAKKFPGIVTEVNKGFEVYPIYKGNKIEAISKRAGAQIEINADFARASEAYKHFRTTFANVETNMEIQQLNEEDKIGLKPAVKVYCEKKLRKDASLEDVAQAFETFVEDRFSKGKRPIFGYVYTKEKIVKTDEEREYPEHESFIRVVADVPETELENWKDEASALIYFVGVFLERRIEFRETEAILPFAVPQYGEVIPEGMMTCQFCGRTLAIDMQGNIKPCPCESGVEEHIVHEKRVSDNFHATDEGRHVC